MGEALVVVVRHFGEEGGALRVLAEGARELGDGACLGGPRPPVAFKGGLAAVGKKLEGVAEGEAVVFLQELDGVSGGIAGHAAPEPFPGVTIKFGVELSSWKGQSPVQFFPFLERETPLDWTRARRSVSFFTRSMSGSAILGMAFWRGVK